MTTKTTKTTAMRNKQGLTQAAFKAGYHQQADNKCGDKVTCERVYLKWAKGAYHLHTNGLVNEGFFRPNTNHQISDWSTYASLPEARKAWTSKVRGVFQEELSEFSNQTRLTVELEFNGNSYEEWVLRNNGTYINGYATLLQAQVMGGKLASLDLVDRHKAIEYVINLNKDNTKA